MNGRAVAEVVERLYPGLPVLFITGYARLGLTDGAEMLPKPFDLEALARRVGNILRRRA
jgi:DNA-binding response OmpR family regulator